MNFEVFCPSRGCGTLGLIETLKTAQVLAATHNQREGDHRAIARPYPAPTSNPAPVGPDQERGKTC